MVVFTREFSFRLEIITTILVYFFNKNVIREVNSSSHEHEQVP